MLSGCAARVEQIAISPRTVSTDWAAVRALPADTIVLFAVDGEGVRAGLVKEVSDTALTIRALYHGYVRVIPRDRVARITERVQTGVRHAPPHIDIPIGAAVLGGLVGIVVGTVQKNKAATYTAFAAFVLGKDAEFGTGPPHYPRGIYENRLVYVRPGT
jgi:hypothetical protein